MFLVPGQLLPTVHDLSEPSLTLPASTLFGEQELNLLTELHLFTAAQIAQLPVTFVFTLPPFLGALVCCGGGGRGEEVLAGSLLLSPQDWLHPFPSPKPCTYFSTACRAASEAKQRLYLETH